MNLNINETETEVIQDINKNFNTVDEILHESLLFFQNVVGYCICTQASQSTSLPRITALEIFIQEKLIVSGFLLPMEQRH